MAIWDGKIRWQLGGNVQPVRMICEIDWRSCPSAIIEYIWSEIVTDVIEVITSEEIMWRAITVISVLLILLCAIWTRVNVMTKKVINENMMNDLNFKLNDLEMRVNVLAYRLHYGAWPFLSKNDEKLTNEEEIIPIKSAENDSSWFRYFLPKCITKNDSQLNLHKSKNRREKSRSHESCNCLEIKELNSRENMIDSKKCEEKVLKLESKLEDCEKSIKDIVFQNVSIGIPEMMEKLRDKTTEMEVLSEESIDTETIKNSDESIIPGKSRLTEVRKQLESLHTVLRTYGNDEASIINSGAIIKRDEPRRIFPEDSSDLLSSTESDEPLPKIPDRPKTSIKNEKIPITKKAPEKFVENMQEAFSLPNDEKSPVFKAPERVNMMNIDSPKRFDDSPVQESFPENVSPISSGSSLFPELKNSYQSPVLDIIPEEQSGSSCNEQKSKKSINSTNHVEESDFSYREICDDPEEIDDCGDEVVGMQIIPVEESLEVEENKDDDVNGNLDIEVISVESVNMEQDSPIDDSVKKPELHVENSEHSIIENKPLNPEERKELEVLKDEDLELLIDVPCFSLDRPLDVIEKQENHLDDGKIEDDLITLDVDDSGDQDLKIEEGSLTRRITPVIETIQENAESNKNKDNESAFVELETLALDALTKIDDFWKKETLVEPIKFDEKVLNVPIENTIYFTMNSLFEEFIEKIAAPEGMKDITEIESPETFRKTCDYGKSSILDKDLHKIEGKISPKSKASAKSSKKVQRNSLMTTVYQSPYSVKCLPPKVKGHPTASKSEALKNAKKLSLKTRSNLNLSSTKNDLGKQKLSKSSIELSQRRSRSYVTPRKLDASPRVSYISQLPCPLLNKRSRPETRERTLDCKLHEKELQRSKSKSGIPLLKTRWENAKSTNFVYRSKSPVRSALTMSTNSRASEDSRSLNNEEFVKESGNSEEQKDHQHHSDGQTIIYVNIVTEQEHSAMKVVNPCEFLDYVKDRALKIQGTGEYIENSCASKILTIVCSTVNENEENRSKDIEISAKTSVVNTSTSISFFPKILYLSENTESHEVKP